MLVGRRGSLGDSKAFVDELVIVHDNLSGRTFESRRKSFLSIEGTQDTHGSIEFLT